MRRFFFRPTFTRLLLSLALTLSTFYFSIIPIQLATDLNNAKFFAKVAIGVAYIAIGPQNPILKIITLLIFWLIVSWVVYLVVWICEVAYVHVYNYLVVQTKYKNK